MSSLGEQTVRVLTLRHKYRSRPAKRLSTDIKILILVTFFGMDMFIFLKIICRIMIVG